MNAEINGVLRLDSMKYDLKGQEVVNGLFEGRLEVKSIFQIGKARRQSPIAVTFRLHLQRGGEK